MMYLTRAAVSLAAIALIAPLVASAAYIRSAPDISAKKGEPFTVYVEINPEDSSLNVVEGVVRIPEGLHVIGVSTEGSAFPLWASAPTYVVKDRAVRFAGGSPEALPSDESARLFAIIVRADNEGTHSFTVEGKAYADDGKGTAIPLGARSEPVSVGNAHEPRGDIPATKSKLVAEIGRDASLFDGAWFVTFYGGDKGSGVAYYEVTEGNREAVRAERYYVLQDQTLSENVRVTAFGNDGSRQSVTIGETNRLLWVLGILVLLAALASWWRWRRARI